MQVAGLIARRILCYVKAGERLARGQRYGFIRFGSRVDVYLPPGSTPAGGDRRQGEGELHGARRAAAPLGQRPMAIPLERQGQAALELARRRGIYLLPNLFTTLNLFAGFYAIVQGMNHEFEKAAVAIFVAMVLDSLDGRVARLTRTQSAFGAEYDSLADMVSFGAAPALVMYEWALRGAGPPRLDRRLRLLRGRGACASRASTRSSSVADKRWFTGLPSPAAAALVAGMIWVFNEYQVPGRDVQLVRRRDHDLRRHHDGVERAFYSGKDINLRRAVPFSVALVLRGGAAADLARALASCCGA